MIIRAEDLDREGLRIDLSMVIEPLLSDADELIQVEEILLQGHVAPTGIGLVFRGRLTGRALVPCARCLEPFPLPVDREFDLRYAFRVPREREIQIPDEELDLDFLDKGEGLDLKAVAAEQIYLTLPMKPLCRAACRGLCGGCGGDLNRGECRCPGLRSQP